MKEVKYRIQSGSDWEAPLKFTCTLKSHFAGQSLETRPDKALSSHKDGENKAEHFQGQAAEREHNTHLRLILAGEQAAAGVNHHSVFSLWIVWIFQKKITNSAKINDITFILLPNPTPPH